MSAVTLASKAPVVLPVVLGGITPLLYLASLFTCTFLLYGWRVPLEQQNFDHYTIAQVSREFATVAAGLSLSGFVARGLCSGVLRRLISGSQPPQETQTA